MSSLVLVCVLVSGCLLICGSEKLPDYPSSSELEAERPRLLVKRSAARHPRDVPLSSYGRLGEREDDNSTTTIITTLPEVETTEPTQSSTEIKEETTTAQSNPDKGLFEFQFNLPTGIFQTKGPQNKDNKPSGQPTESAPVSPFGFKAQAPKLPIPSFGFGRR